MLGKVNLRQFISLVSFGAGHHCGCDSVKFKTVHSFKSKIFPFVLLLPKSTFATAITLGNELVNELGLPEYL